ncbi:iron-siderophore ABC transporter substrate-binding protein [Streptomyces pactum]|uniref:Iron-siderophore ABC transporter substrate-binding protein n=1 Tax=Streptomyces pactum TaxID=68249 RepID=A0ABS0NH89_9ACTN|nr:iron-siderophore ABC transporter substrate-binding protein [Streptomyces pactum]MBH5334531.1 iron-siderophore ABC transporter substrate-binding protein [Streptomyces pactum]
MPHTLNGRRRGRIGTLVLAAALSFGLAACGESGGSDSSSSSSSSEAGAESSAGFPRTVQHHKGKTEIKTKPKRVVALDNSLVEAVVALDRPLIAGIGSYRDQKGFPDYLGDAVKDTKDVGPLDSPNLEQIAALRPDLIISASVRHEELYDQLSEIAPTVFVETTGPTWKDNLTLVGEALGEEAKAKEVLSTYETRAKKIGDAINAKAGKPEVSIVRFVDGPTRIYLPKTFSGIVLQDMGLARPENQRDPEKFNIEISEEQIGQADGDVIFYTTFSGGEEREEKFLGNPLWKRLGAVRSGDVHKVDDEIWMTSVSAQGAHRMLDDMARVFGVDAAK